MPFIQFGGGTLGEGAFATIEDVGPLLETLAACGITEIDTAGVYPASAPGASERLLGAVKASDRGFTINTKIMVTGDGPGQGSLRKEAIDKSVQRSLTTLGLPKINVLHCHIPDTATPVEETAAALHDHWSKANITQVEYLVSSAAGRYSLLNVLVLTGPSQQIGLSNYSVAQVEDFLSTCDMHGWRKPTVFQGQYNALCRGMEKDLLPLLRRHNMAYVAFSPLAGGFLTGNFSLGHDLEGTRFAEGNTMGAHYRPMYDKPAMHTAIRKLHALLEPRGFAMAEAALRWVFHHSALGPQDAIILGATSRLQIEHNTSEVQKGPLPAEIVDMFDKVWDEVKDSAP
ncbi:MAG: hypothetical protein Q9192_002595 [Flavoplaca navasiana]